MRRVPIESSQPIMLFAVLRVALVAMSVIALVVQILVFVVVRMLLPGLTTQIEEGKFASGAFLGMVSLAAGVLNAASMTY